MAHNIPDALLLLRARSREGYRIIRRIATKGELHRFQQQRLITMLLHADRNVPYYHRVFRRVGLIRAGRVDLSKFDRIPLLTKDIIRHCNGELISKDYRSRRWQYNTSGGSTGEPVRLIRDRQLEAWNRSALYYYYKDMLGIEEPVAKKVILWGSERDIFKSTAGMSARMLNWCTRTTVLNSFRMDNGTMDRYISTINALQPDLIRGYAGSLYELCQHASNENVALHSPKVLVSSAETLSDEMRRVIESSFGTAVRDFYGAREVPSIAAECASGSTHSFSFLHFLEVVDDDAQPVSPGEGGKIVLTNLHNYTMPLIRYEIGDTAVFGGADCPCGSALPVLTKVTGRVTDHFITKSGALVHGEYFTHLFYFKNSVKRFRVIQENYDRIRILAVLNHSLDEADKEDIEQKIRLVMGECSITWEIVDDIPHTPSGKYLYTISLVDKDHKTDGRLSGD